MVNIAQRMRRLHTLLAIRLGPGAAILPKNVQRIHMDFAVKINDGHRGPRKFWRHMLPRLKYHNPSVPMTVERREDQKGPATLSIHLRQPQPTNSKASELAKPLVDVQGSSNPSVITIDMKNKNEDAIWEEFMKVSGAKEVKPTKDETQMLVDLEEQSVKSKKDSERSKLVRAQFKKEQAMLDAARGAV